MSIDFNLVVLGGRLTSDPTPVGDKGCKFDIAINRSYKKDGERVEDTTYMPVTVWGVLSELVMQRCTKGSQVLVDGRIEVRKFDGDDGTPRKYVNIVASDVRFVDKRSFDSETSEEEPAHSPFTKGVKLPAGVSEESANTLLRLLQNQQAAG